MTTLPCLIDLTDFSMFTFNSIIDNSLYVRLIMQSGAAAVK